MSVILLENKVVGNVYQRIYSFPFHPYHFQAFVPNAPEPYFFTLVASSDDFAEFYRTILRGTIVKVWTSPSVELLTIPLSNS